jgi:hypothetical protein
MLNAEGEAFELYRANAFALLSVSVLSSCCQVLLASASGVGADASCTIYSMSLSSPTSEQTCWLGKSLVKPAPWLAEYKKLCLLNFSLLKVDGSESCVHCSSLVHHRNVHLPYVCNHVLRHNLSTLDTCILFLVT